MYFTGINSHKVDEDGLGETMDLNLDSNPYWTHISVSEILVISDKKPEINQIESINAKTKTTRQKIICTPKSVVCNVDGKCLTGRILVIEGELSQRIHYTGDLPEQSIHTENFISNFSTSIVVPWSIKGIDSLNMNFQVNICIEDVLITGVLGREILESIVLLIQAVPIYSLE